MKNVAIILDSFSIGGAERQAFNLAIELKEKQFNVTVIALTTTGKGEEILKEHNIPYEVLGLNYSYSKKVLLKNFISLRKVLVKENIQVILPYTYWPNVLASNSKKSKMISIWNQRDEGRKVMVNYFEKRALKRSNHIISNSNLGKEFLINSFGLNESDVLVINNGVQLARPIKAAIEWRKDLGIEATDTCSVMLANYHHFKDHLSLISAWDMVLNKIGSNHYLFLAGRNGGMELEMNNLIKQLDISDNVKLLGSVNDVSGLMEGADLLVHSSNNEGCPNSVIEGMLSELPVVATDISGCRQALGEGYQYLNKEKDVDKLAANIIQLLSNPKERSILSKSNLVRAQSEFSINNMVENYIELFN